MPGPKKQYPIQIAVRLTVAMIAKLDKLAKGSTRAETIRKLITDK